MWLTVEQSGGRWSGNVVHRNSGRSLFLHVPRDVAEAFGISAGEVYVIRIVSKGRADMAVPGVPDGPEAQGAEGGA